MKVEYGSAKGEDIVAWCSPMSQKKRKHGIKRRSQRAQLLSALEYAVQPRSPDRLLSQRVPEVLKSMKANIKEFRISIYTGMHDKMNFSFKTCPMSVVPSGKNYETYMKENAEKMVEVFEYCTTSVFRKYFIKAFFDKFVLEELLEQDSLK